MAHALENEIAALAPDIRRYCIRMLNSAFDGDDIAQETLANALAKQNLLKDGVPLKPWLLRIAHNKCIDFLRYQSRWQTVSEEIPTSETTPIDNQSGLERLVVTLPPRQRAMLLLKEVFGFSLEEIASTLMCTKDAVKSGLTRARSSLANQGNEENMPQPDDSQFRLIERYSELFNLADWDGVLNMLHSEVELNVSGIYLGVGADKVLNRYCTNYCKFEFPWISQAAYLTTEPCVLVWRTDTQSPSLIGAARVKVQADKIIAIQDYLHDDEMMQFISEELALTSAPVPKRASGLTGRTPPQPI